MKRPFNGTFPITQEHGVNAVDYAKFGLKGHNGVDYGTPTGTPILAPHNGKVIESAFDQYGYGNYVKIENDKEGSILAHFKSFNVNAGDTVSEGQQVGISDNTGNSTGPHLHWGYYRMPRNKSDGFSGTTNPYPYLQDSPTSPIDDCPAKLLSITAERDRLNGVITHKDELLQSLQDSIGAKNSQISGLENERKQLADSLLLCQNSSASYLEIAKKVPEMEKLLKEQESSLQSLKEERTNLQKTIGAYKGRWELMKWSLKRLIVEKIIPMI